MRYTSSTYQRPQHGPASSAFTLVELLTVVAIIAVLASILLPALARARRSAYQVVCASNLKQVGIAFELYSGDHGDYVPAPHRTGFDEGVGNWHYWLGENGYLGAKIVYQGSRVTSSQTQYSWPILQCPGEPGFLGEGYNVTFWEWYRARSSYQMNWSFGRWGSSTGWGHLRDGFSLAPRSTDTTRVPVSDIPYVIDRTNWTDGNFGGGLDTEANWYTDSPSPGAGRFWGMYYVFRHGAGSPGPSNAAGRANMLCLDGHVALRAPAWQTGERNYYTIFDKAPIPTTGP